MCPHAQTINRRLTEKPLDIDRPLAYIVLRTEAERKMTKTYIVTGKTYAHRDTIKYLGGQWDVDKQGWIVDAKAAEWLSNNNNFGRRAIRLGSGLVITEQVQ